MTDKLVTTDVIIGHLKNKIENKEPLSPGIYIDAAEKLNVLLSDEHDKLFTQQQKIAEMKVTFLEADPKRNVSMAKLLTEATNEYREMQIQKAKIGRIEEMIRLAKIQAKMKETEFRGY